MINCEMMKNCIDDEYWKYFCGVQFVSEQKKVLLQNLFKIFLKKLLKVFFHLFSQFNESALITLRFLSFYTHKLYSTPIALEY
jgi:hypothetical protein